jgi:hypothetical protein
MINLGAASPLHPTPTSVLVQGRTGLPCAFGMASYEIHLVANRFCLQRGLAKKPGPNIIRSPGPPLGRDRGAGRGTEGSYPFV